MPTVFALRSRLGIGFVKEARLLGFVFGGGYKIFYTLEQSKAMKFENYDQAVKTLEVIRSPAPCGEH